MWANGGRRSRRGEGRGAAATGEVESGCPAEEVLRGAGASDKAVYRWTADHGFSLAFKVRASRHPAEEIGLCLGGGSAGRVLDGDELEELTRVLSRR